MLIHSKFKDYYDSASAYGVDTNIHYVRDQLIWTRDQIPEPLQSCYQQMHDQVKSVWRSWRDHLGDTYPCIIAVGTVVRRVIIVHNEQQYVCCSSIQDLITHSKDPKLLQQKLDNSDRRTYFWGLPLHSRLQRFFEPISDQQRSQIESMMVAANSPTMLVGYFHQHQFEFVRHIVGSCGNLSQYPVVCFNPLLAHYNIARVVDPFTAHQEIMMFLTNQLCINQPEMITISDKDKRDSKGFDDMSFKNRGTKKPRRKRK